MAGVDVAIVERRPTPELVGSRAGGFHARTLEILDQRGIADRFLAEGQAAQAAGFGTTMLDLSDFPTRHPYSLGLWQNHIERILLGWVEELGCRSIAASRSPASPRTTTASTSRWPRASRYGRRTWSGPMAGAA